MKPRYWSFGLYASATLLVAALLAGCGGGSSSQAIPTGVPPGPSATPTPPGPSSTTMVTSAGSINGKADQFMPTQGDTSSGGNGQSVDGVSCDSVMADTYHIHIFLGIYVNGVQYAVPTALGMENPAAPQNGFVNSATCFYWLHSHDSSGIVHVESPDPTGIPITQSAFTLKTLFDIWGITVNANQFGTFSGPVRVFTSGQTYQGGVATIPASDYTYWNADPNTIPIYSHEVVMIEVGPTYPASLPNVHFYEQY